MKRHLLSSILTQLCLLFSLLIISSAVYPTESNNPQNIAIAIHGGAGTISKQHLTPEIEAAYIATLGNALDTGYALLEKGEEGTSAVLAAIMILEDSPLFNAGIGAVYTYEGEHELDASIMHGKQHAAGAVAGVKSIKNPIVAAQAVIDHSIHVMLSGEGAETFAHNHGIEKVDNAIFNTERRFDALQRAKANINENLSLHRDALGSDMRFGTVGAVVLDKFGNIVAGTSTGGMTAKRFGRVGDSPIIGAGTFADNNSCGVSATGHGEYFIKYNVAADICARMKYQGVSLEEAANTVINRVLKDAGGDGGVIAVDRLGNVSMPFNTPGMYRASIDAKGNKTVAIF
ncbi:MAG: isoaspartyl peptidase/L-asparaginase [Pseudomonadota bacterium]